MKANLLFQETSSWTNLTLVEFAVSVAVELTVKRSSSASINATNVFIPRSSLTALVKRFMRLSRAKSTLLQSIHANGFLTHDGFVDLGFQKHYRVQHGNDESAVAPTISAASKASGASPKSGLSNFVVCQRIRSTCILKNCEFRFNYRN